MAKNQRIRQNSDKWGVFEEEQTGRGWRMLSRTRNGKRYNIYNAETDDYIRAISAEGWELRLNDMSNRIELGVGKPIDDFVHTAIIARLKDLGFKSGTRIGEAIQVMALDNKYHPVKEYFDALEWDGQDHFAALMNCLEMSSPAAEVFWRKFFLGAIGKALDRKQNYMLVMLGAQGKGKSRLCRWLCPLENLFYEGPIDPGNKDTHIRTMNMFLWEAAELDATTRKSDVSALRHFISQQMITVRVPYGRHDITKPAVASFIGTVNEDGAGFLSDPSGNRRFAVVHVDDIDWNYVNIDKDQLWAQLYRAYESGESHELTPHEQEVQNEINKEHRAVSDLEHYLDEHFVLDPSDVDSYMGLVDIINVIRDRENSYDKRWHWDLGRIMIARGMQKSRRRIDGKLKHVYLGVKPTAQQFKDINL